MAENDEHSEKKNGDAIVAEPVDTQGEVAEVVSSSVSSFSGPLPSPETLEGYEQIIPGLPNRIVEEWENQGAHRRETETSIVRSTNIHAHTGQWMAFFLSLFGLTVAAVIALLSDHQWAAAVVGSAALGVPPLISLFKSRR